MEQIKPVLSEVPATLLVPLWARAEELARPEPIVRDEKALEILKRLDFDFGRFKGGWKSQTGVAIRTLILDREVQRFLEERPGAVVVNLGCGLDAREERVTGYGRWWDLDLTETIALRRCFFAETDRIRMIEASAFDPAWVERLDLAAGEPVLIVAEGLLMYFSEREVASLFRLLADRLPGAVILAELVAPLLVGRGRMHDTVKNAEFRWSLTDSRDLERLEPRIRFDAEWSYFDCRPERWRWMRLFRRLRWVRRNLNNRIVRYHLIKQAEV